MIFERIITCLAAAVLGGLAVWAGSIAFQQHRALVDETLAPVYTLVAPALHPATPTAEPTATPPATSATEALLRTINGATPLPTTQGAASLGVCGASNVADARQSAGTMATAEAIHQYWADRQEQGTPVPNVGDTAWHRQWVANYEQVRRVLSAYLTYCRAGGG